MSRRHVSDAQRRARLGVAHRLSPAHRAGSAEEVVESLVVLHASDPSAVFLSAGARLSVPGPAGLERALYEDGTLVRMHGMRRTVYVVSRGSAPVVHASSTLAVAVRDRAGLMKFLADSSEAWDGERLAGVERRIVAALADGAMTTSELTVAVPELAERITVGRGKPYEAQQGVGSRVLTVLGMDGHILRGGRPQGSWTSGLNRWTVAPPMPVMDVGEAKAELVRRYLGAYGPATEGDVKWWTGWSLGDVRKALVVVEAVDLDGGDTGYVLPGMVFDHAPEPYVALLPALDPTSMGWQQRHWYLDAEHRAELFDYSGNIGPTVWCDGRIVGGWAQRADGSVVWRLLADAPSALIEEEAARLEGWVGGVRFKPRFRTPVEKALTA